MTPEQLSKLSEALEIVMREGGTPDNIQMSLPTLRVMMKDMGYTETQIEEFINNIPEQEE